MYRLYRLGSLTNPDALWLDYEWDESFDNTEWRPCVEHFLGEVVAQGHVVLRVAVTCIRAWRRFREDRLPGGWDEDYLFVGSSAFTDRRRVGRPARPPQRLE